MRSAVAIHGTGLAACCCARLLAQNNWLDLLWGGHGSNTVAAGPTLLINQSTQKLLGDVFETHDLFREGIEIRKRVVLWGSAPKPVTLPHSGMVLNEARLLETLRASMPPAPLATSPQVPDWSVYSTASVSSGIQHNFGARIASGLSVRLKHEDTASCWIESLNHGWLFLLPTGRQTASLLAIGASPELLLHASRLIAGEIDCATAEPRQFPAHPRILDPLTGPDWLACGSAAIGFDPICGEGAGNAVREAILAAAVLRATQTPAFATDARAYYSARLSFGFLRHLEACKQFYDSAHPTAWWQQQSADLDRGITFMNDRLKTAAPPRFQLNGFALEPRS